MNLLPYVLNISLKTLNSLISKHIKCFDIIKINKGSTLIQHCEHLKTPLVNYPSTPNSSRKISLSTYKKCINPYYKPRNTPHEHTHIRKNPK